MNTRRQCLSLVRRHMQLYFRDKLNFFLSLLTPLILLVLFVTFLRTVYIDSITAVLPPSFPIEESLLEGFAGGWLVSSLLGVSCVTVAFCSNIVMIHDKIHRRTDDLLVAPVRRDTLAMSYFLANVLSTGIVCLAAAGVGFAYLAAVGWYLSVTDVLLILLDLVLGVLFGTALASLCCSGIATEGGEGAMTSMVSSMYGFISGAYMPVAQFAAPIRAVISCLPGTYGIGLLRRHFLGGALAALEGRLPSEAITALGDGFDANLYFFGHAVEVWQMYAVMVGTVAVLLAANILLARLRRKP